MTIQDITLKSPKDEVWGFAFNLRNPSTRALYNFDGIDYRYLIFPKNIDTYLKKILESKPLYIIGIGMSNPGARLKVELEARNRHGKRIIENNSPFDTRIDIKGSLEFQTIAAEQPELLESFRFTKSIGWSWCNLVAWKIQKLIDANSLRCKLIFIHYPKGLALDLAVENLQKLLSILEIEE